MHFVPTFCCRLKRELEEEKAISKLNATKAASPTVKTVIIKPAARKKKGNKHKNTNDNANKRVYIVFSLLVIYRTVKLVLRMYAPHVFCFLRKFCTAHGANARACTGYLSFHTLASEKR